MSISIAHIHAHPRYGFRFAQVSGTGDADHASWWSFEDEQSVRDRHWNIRSGDTVLDVGAAFGSYALPALAMGARVVAFSPADFDTSLLAENLKLNPELAARCLVVRDGVHERSGWFQPDRCEFQLTRPMNREEILRALDSPNPGWERTTTSMLEKCEGWLRVRSLDSWLDERPGVDRVDWLKLDVEGAELGVLRGAERCLRQHRPRLLIECHKFHVPTIEQDIDSFLRPLGYTTTGPVQHCAVSHVYYEVKS